MDSHSMDTSSENQEITVSLIDTFAYGPSQSMIRLADTTGFPSWSAPLTSDEAHKLGVWLIELAEEAQLRNLEAEQLNA